MLAQGHDALVGGGLLRLCLGSWRDSEKELGIVIASEVMAEHTERAWGVAEIARDVLGGPSFEEVRSERFVHALFGLERL